MNKLKRTEKASLPKPTVTKQTKPSDFTTEGFALYFMNTIIRKNCSVEPNLKRIGELSDKLGLHKRLTELLFSRGIDTEERIRKFLYPDENALYDPFLMKNMREAVARLRAAMASREKIVIYGDYDADGVCSSAILALFFASRGLDVVVHIPNRVGDGYGLNVDSIESIIEEHSPDLILTCDCGISGANEVEHCKDLGVDVIVTDHHEPSDILPDCIVVNPKQSGDEYPDKFLCGAGVALKLIQALCEDNSYLDYLDIAAVATIADLVPLLDENRLIVQLGLAKLSGGNCNFGLKKLLRSQSVSGAVSSQDIAYKIAPRINAAGRMGDAYRAFEMLTLLDGDRIAEIIGDIEKDNDNRKELCDRIYAEAQVDLALENIIDNRAIILSNPEWAKGVTGIAAARFAGEYNRPTFIIVDRSDDGVFKGTARGIKGVNIYESLAYCSDLLIEFGGHTGAAGFSVHEDNIPDFKARVNEYMSTLPAELFMPSASYDLDIQASECNKALLNAINLIEPTGNGNTRPLFRTVARNVKVSPCKNPQHSSVQIDGLQTYAFNFFNRNQFLMGDANKEIVFELTDGLNGGISAYVKAVSTSELYVNNTFARANFLGSLMLPTQTNQAVYKTYERKDLQSLLPDSVYGTLFVCADKQSYDTLNEAYGNRFVIHDYMYKSEKNNYSGIIVSPVFSDETTLGNYRRIVFVDRPPSDNVVAFVGGRTDAEIYLPSDDDGRIFEGISCDRGVFAAYYSAIISHSEVANLNPIVYFKKLSAIKSDISAAQFVFCLAVFLQLGFVSFVGNRLKVNAGVHKPLTDSDIYATLAARA